jgi:hypothetical protein
MSKQTKKLVFIELNEINFEYVNFYIDNNRLLNFKKLIGDYGILETHSEDSYHLLEPWIQWPTVRTGKNFSKSNIFRLGDISMISSQENQQHWELLERHGFSVAAISPINAQNRTKSSPFWIPDPWTESAVSGGFFERKLYQSLVQLVNDNSQSKLSVKSFAIILWAILSNSSFSSFLQQLGYYLKISLKREGWRGALILDRLLSDIFLNLWKKHLPDFSVLFLNAGAHLQHHYLFSAAFYKGPEKNPSWYMSSKCDPVLEAYELYDKIIGEFISNMDARFIIATGLRQVPNKSPSYYWRLKNHQAFFQKLNIKFSAIFPRMTRDFLVRFNNNSDRDNALRVIKSITSLDGENIFSEIEVRESELFVILTYSGMIDKNFVVIINGAEYLHFHSDISFVAIKNGVHDGVGYLIDTDPKPTDVNGELHISHIFKRVLSNFGVSSSA